MFLIGYLRLRRIHERPMRESPQAPQLPWPADRAPYLTPLSSSHDLPYGPSLLQNDTPYGLEISGPPSGSSPVHCQNRWMLQNMQSR